MLPANTSYEATLEVTRMHIRRIAFPSRRWALRFGLPAAASAALVAGLIAVTHQAQADTANPYLPSYGHPYRHGAVPNTDAVAKIQGWNAAHRGIAAASANNLTYGGGNHGIGVTIGAPKAYIVFWGSQWGTMTTDSSGYMHFSNDTAGLAVRVQKLLKGLGTNNEKWSGVMTQYCEGVATGAQTCPAKGVPHVGYPYGGALAGTWYDNGSATPTTSTAFQLGQEAVTAAGHFGNSTPQLNRNAQYVIVSPHGTQPDGFNNGVANFCAWRDWSGDVGATSTAGDIAFTNLPYTLDAGINCGTNFLNTGTAGTLDGVSIVEGHEYAETITDQNPAGGWDGPKDENGDACIWIAPGTQGGAANVSFSTGSFAMQATWSNSFNSGAGGCEISHSIVEGDSYAVGYVWNDQPTTAGCHVPSTSYSRSTRSDSSVNTICRNSTGSYTVHFAGLASNGGNVEVSAYESSARSCKVGSWFPSGTEQLVNVFCSDFAGNATDSNFTAEYAKGGSASNTFAFAWANNATSASYTPSTTYQYNSHGGRATIKRNSTGNYTVSFPDTTTSHAQAAGSVKVTAYGSGSGVCKVASWGPNSGKTAETVNVLCFTSAGAASDEQFSIAYLNKTNLVGDKLDGTAYARADQPSSGSYTPSSSYQFDQIKSTTATVTITRSAVGTYAVHLPKQDGGWDGGHVQVTAYGVGTDRCQVQSWFGETGGRVANILCFNNSGSSVDARYVVEYTAQVQ
jgi:serine protease